MAGSQEADAVYLEDIETPSPQIATPSSQSDQDASESSGLPGASAAKSEKATAVANNKRKQPTLLDMFAGSQTKKSSEPVTKKFKLSVSAPATARSGTASVASSSKTLRLNAIPFSLAQYQESLSADERGLLALECACMGKSWLKVLKDEIKKPYFISLKKFLWEEGVRGPDEIPKPLKVYPSPNNIYAWSNTPLGKIKVVILGQDPYHGPQQAMGLCFSVPPGVPTPPSLRNIYAEIKSEYPEFEPPKHGNLTAWADNGVLMLNTCLTVKASQAGSHSNKGWEEFTDKVVDVVDKYGGANLGDPQNIGFGRGVVFLAWGSWAAKRVAKLSKTKHLILTSAHPSPLSAHRGFLGNGHFKAANEWLEGKYGVDSKVDWCSLDN